MTDLEPIDEFHRWSSSLDPDAWYSACPVCDAKATVQVQAIDGTTESMPCPACVDGLVQHQCA
jgi:hypothetical protein